MAPHKKDDGNQKTTATATPVVEAPTPGHKTNSCASSIHLNLPVKKVVVHPLVLLSVVDHFNRVSKTQNVKRVVGVLLGSMKADKTLDIANSFAGTFFFCYYLISLDFFQFLLMKMKKTRKLGSLIWIILKACMLCFTRLLLRKRLLVGITLDLNYQRYYYFKNIIFIK